MKHFILISLAAFFATQDVHAAAFRAEPVQVIGGGGQCYGSRFIITGSIGQPDIGLRTGVAGHFEAGFWAAGAPAPIPPVCCELIGPPRVMAECQTPNGAPVAWTVFATNHCGQDLTVTCSPAPGSWFPPGTHYVTCTATGSGVSQTCTFPVVVEGSCGGLCEENLLVNGSFERPGAASGYSPIPPGVNPALLPGWTVLSPGVEAYDGTTLNPLVREPGPVADGSFALDLAYGTGGGGVEQFVTTTPGERYTLSFYAGTLERDGRDGTGNLEVSIVPSDLPSFPTYPLVNHNNRSRWERYTFSFVAQSSSTLVKLTTTDNALFHFVEIDDVRLTRCPSPCVQPPQDLVLWLPFDEAGGLTADNAVGAAYNGRLFNGDVSDGAGPARLSPGYVNRALNFDGLNDWVCVGDYEALNVGASDFTFDAWVRLAPDSTTGGNRLIAGKFLQGREGIRFGTDAGYLFFAYNGILAVYGGYDTVPVPNDGQWHLVAVTVQRGLFSGGQFYIDGVPTGTFDTRGALAGELSTPGPLGVGGLRGREAWSGGIDEFEFFRRSLSAGEIRALHGAGATGKCRMDGSLRWNTTWCPGATSGDVPATIRNLSAQSRTITYQFQSVPCPGAPSGSALGFSPASGTVTVPAYGEANFPVGVTLPNTHPCGIHACFEMVLRDNTGVLTVSGSGAIARSCQLCVVVPLPHLTLTNLQPRTIPLIQLQNPGSTGLVSIANGRWVVYGPDQRVDTRVVSLNGNPPGPVAWPFPPPGLPPNGVLDLPLTVAFTSYQPGQRFTVVLEADVNNTSPQAIASFDLINEFLPATPANLNIARGPNGTFVLNWTDDRAVLESAPTITGPWTESPSGAINAVIVPSPNTAAKFFRLRR